MSDIEKISITLDLHFGLSTERIPQLVERLSNIAEVSGISLNIEHVSASGNSSKNPNHELPNLNKDLIEYRSSSEQRVPVVTRRALGKYARGATFSRGLVWQAWDAIGYQLAPITRTKIIANEAAARGRALRQEDADYYGAFEPWSDTGMGRLSHIYAERFPDFVDMLESRASLPKESIMHVTNFGPTCLRLFKEFNESLFISDESSASR